MLLLAGQMFTQSFYTYLFNDYFHANWMNLASQACTYSPMLIMMFVLPKMARNIGKRETSVCGVTLAALANLVLFFMRGISPDKLIWPFLGLCFISGCGLTVLVMQLWAMATDAIDDVSVKSGTRDDGTAYSYFAFFRKLGQVIAAICVNGALFFFILNRYRIFHISQIICRWIYIFCIFMFGCTPWKNWILR